MYYCWPPDESTMDFSRDLKIHCAWVRWSAVTLLFSNVKLELRTKKNLSKWNSLTGRNGFSDRLADFLFRFKQTLENEKQKVVCNCFLARKTRSTWKCHGNFKPEIYLINLRLLNSNEYDKILYVVGGRFSWTVNRPAYWDLNSILD